MTLETQIWILGAAVVVILTAINGKLARIATAMSNTQDILYDRFHVPTAREMEREMDRENERRGAAASAP